MSVALNVSKRDERRETILDVARDCFLADGYATTSMSTIAARLGGSKGTLYNYFKNKEELFAAVIQRQCGEVLEGISEAPADEPDPRTRLLRMARNLLARLLQPDALAINRLVIAEGDRFPELGRLFYESGPRRGRDRIAAQLKPLMDSGQLRRADPLQAASQLKDLTIGNVLWLRLWGAEPALTAEEIDGYVVRGIDTFLRAYAP
ncbi:MAG: TetR/AcrR family transcriptional regulator [Caulobacterales bacterium]|nr:TetR/AcrR family transcriptional regulator [Caulobacterales bacterium]